jgi:aerobic carbon-monoxide dehydrogenase large subunit
MDAHEHHAFEPRVEDNQLVRGGGRFVEDAAQPGQAFAAFVRSPHAFAKIVSVNADDARAAAGVLAVLTAKDMEGIGSIARHPPMTGRGGTKLAMPFRPALAGERVMHLGEPVAMVVAQSAAAAQDAAELVAVDYEELASVIDVRDAVRDGAPQLYPDVPGNMAIDWPGPAADADANAREVEGIIAGAPKVARVSHVNQRMVVNSMEPRGGTGSYDAATESYTLRVCSQGAGPLAEQIASIMRLPKEKLRVITEDVGGAFGLKTAVYPEYPALLVAARKVGRPVQWMSSRSEAFLTDNHARDAVTEAELALDEKGKFLALRVRHLANMGAYITPAGAHLATNNFARCFPGMYRIANIDAATRCVFTNTVPTGPYRGAGRPEANYILERVVDEAARLTGIDRVRLRRRNLIPASSIPYKTAVGTTYDSGEFPAIFDKALELSGHAEFNKRRREAKSRGKYRGIGISCFLEHAGGMPTEGAALMFPGGDTLVLGLGVQSTGQAHATVFPRLVAEKLGISPKQIQHRHGDTNLGITGMPSVASRSAITAGTAIVRAIEAMLAKGKSLAAGMLEAADADIAYRNGNFEVVGTDRRISLFEVANRAAEAAKRGGNAETLDTKLSVDTPQTFPNGVHIAEVEVDPATGLVHVVSYTAVDDCGNVLDHTIVEGQVQGALAQGLGQALKEVASYDASGQLVTGSFMDYAMPRAEDMPPIRDALHPVPATTNPLGVKGVGEAGTTASIAAVMNAIADAIPGEAGAKLDMPATPEKVWKACRDGATYRLV